MPDLGNEGYIRPRTADQRAPEESQWVSPHIELLGKEPNSCLMTDPSTLPQPTNAVLPHVLLETEASFYHQYSWCLNAFPTLGEVIEHLSGEVDRLRQVREDWQTKEVMANIFLFSCAITDALDDHVLGSSYDFSKLQSRLPILRPLVSFLNQCQKGREKFRNFRLRSLMRWMDQWEAAVHDFLRIFASGEIPETDRLTESLRRLLTLLETEFPAEVRSRRVKNPAAFRSQDLTGFDVLKLGQKFVSALIDRNRDILLIGLRTAGSYFAPLLRAYLANEGYRNVSCVTLRPKKGASAREMQRIAQSGAKGALAVIIDEPVGTGSTLVKCAELLQRNGIPQNNVVAMFPVHPSRRDWSCGDNFLALSNLHILPLMPEEYVKHELLQPEKVEDRLREYFGIRGWQDLRVIDTATTKRLNSQLSSLSEEKFHNRIKRIFEVQLESSSGEKEIRYVMAKGVGWGWWSYHAFLAGELLAGYVPTMLGLRDGILFTEWVPQVEESGREINRAQLVRNAASYVAARCKSLPLRKDPSPDLARAGWHQGFELLTEVLSRAYGWGPTRVLKRYLIRSELSRRPCPVPTLIDGKMRPLEWVQTHSTLLKADFEQHGLGKIELCVTDPAYDLAEAILYFRLSEHEEKALLTHYAQSSGDTSVRERLFLHKLLAGKWAMHAALANLKDPRLAARHSEFDQQYLNAWNFSMIHTAQLCGSLCRQPKELQWRSPIVMLDIDGVLDKQIFGFPSNTAAGIRAISLLHSHGFPVALNTARSPLEVKEYCRAYGFVGGAAEYGSYVWDALTDQEQVLVSPESLEEMAKLRRALQSFPGVYLNPDYQFSVKVYTYESGRTVPLPTVLLQDLMASLGLRRLQLHQTYTDSTISAQEVNKGRGMQALLELAGLPKAETFAIGDTEPDLPMFRLAARCFAPAQVSCRQVARLLGCQIARSPFQVGLLEIVRTIVHPDGGSCGDCQTGGITWPNDSESFMKALEAADQKRLKLLLQALLDRRALQAFAK